MTGKLKPCDEVAVEREYCAHDGASVAGGIWHAFTIVVKNVQ